MYESHGFHLQHVDGMLYAVITLVCGIQPACVYDLDHLSLFFRVMKHCTIKLLSAFKIQKVFSNGLCAVLRSSFCVFAWFLRTRLV